MLKTIDTFKKRLKLNADTFNPKYEAIMERIINIHVINKLPEGFYPATSKEIQGFVAQGRTTTEALEIVRDVARKLIKACSERSKNADFAPTHRPKNRKVVNKKSQGIKVDLAAFPSQYC